MTKPSCHDGVSDARLRLGQDDACAAARKPWRRPELKILAAEETKTGLGGAHDGRREARHSS